MAAPRFKIFAMRKISLTAFLLLSLPCDLSSAEEAYRLEKIVVTPTRIRENLSEDSRSVTVIDKSLYNISSYTAMPDVIASVGGVDIRRRGPEGVQSDMDIRGATFEQNTVLIDATCVNDPQTGHFNTDLPLTSLDIERMEIMKGPASSLYGANSFGGVINIITKKPDGKEFVLSSQGGSFDYFQSAMSLSYPLGPVNNRFSIEESRSTGYMPETEFNIFTLSDAARIETFLGEYDFLFGYLKKDFGADSFYSNLYNNEEEHTDTRFFNIRGLAENGNLAVVPRVYLRRHRDKFMLDANRPGWQTNYSTNYSYGGELGFSLTGPFMDTAYGFALSRDTIDSTNLQTHARMRNGIYAEISPHLWDALYLNAGLRQDYFSDFGLEYSPSVSACYRVLRDFSVRGLVGRSYRIPTFTDLYYNDKGNIGNSGLGPESSWTYEAGADYAAGPTSCSATFFHRDSCDTIDWTRLTPNVAWQASNIGSASTNGFELSLDIKPKNAHKSAPIEMIFMKYTVLDIYDKHDYLSKYALDYLKQQISAGIEYDLAGFGNSWVLNYDKRVGDSGYVVVDTKLTKKIIDKSGLFLEAFFGISNLFDVSYSEQSDVPMPGRWIRSGARLRF